MAEEILIYPHRLSEETVISFSRQLQALLAAGIPLFKAIQIIQTQATSTVLRSILTLVNEQLAEGNSLATALAKFPKTFTPFYTNIIKVGERHGELDNALARIYGYLESTRENKQKIINSLTYPAILIASGLTVLILMIVLVLPKFISIFTQSGIPLPLPTKILLAVNHFFSKYFIWLGCGFIALLGSLFMLNKNPETKYYLDKYKLGIPVLGDLLRSVYIARFCRTFGILHNSGVQLLESIELSKTVLSNKVLEQEVNNLAQSVRNGEGISLPLAASKVFPPMMVQMVAVGEQTGALDKLLLDVANYYEIDSDLKIKKLLTLIEPLALVFISILVAFIAASIMLPLFRMAGTMRSF